MDSNLEEGRENDRKKKEVKKTPSNIFLKLFNRELHGKPIERTHNESSVFLPDRLVFSLHQIAPISALESGHIFLGWSKCGFFMLSYTNGSMASWQANNTLTYTYRLTWWEFVPYRPLRRVAEIPLFGEAVMNSQYLLLACFWHLDYTKIIIYAMRYLNFYSSDDETRHVHVTITGVPSLEKCEECRFVAYMHDENEDVSEMFEALPAKCCLRHGFVVNTEFTMVSPFPKFLPSVSMARDGCVVFNTGSFFHVLQIDVEFKKENAGVLTGTDTRSEVSSFCEDKKSECDSICNEMKASDIDKSDSISLNIAHLSSKAKLPTSAPSPRPHCSRMNILTSDTESDLTYESQEDRRLLDFSFDSDDSQAEDVRTSVAHRNAVPVRKCPIALQQICSKPRRSIMCNKYYLSSVRDAGQTSPKTSSLSKVKLAEKAYEFTEENAASMCEKLSVFRKKRLADKTYEFTDENSENVIPVLRPTRRSQVPQDVAPSEVNSTGLDSFDQLLLSSNINSKIKLQETPRDFDSEKGELTISFGDWTNRSPADHETDVLKPINHYRFDNMLLSPREQVQDLRELAHRIWDARERNNKAQERLRRKNRRPRSRLKKGENCWMFNVSRRYFEGDEEVLPLTTDNEEDDVFSISGDHIALPLEVHGSANARMHMVPPQKEHRLSASSILIQQKSLDLDHYCQKLAEQLCVEAGMIFCFCDNYDVEIVHVCPESGDVIGLAALLVSANEKPKGSTKVQRSSVQRKQYQVHCCFIWSVDLRKCSVTDKSSFSTITESPNLTATWNPTSGTARELLRNLGAHLPRIKYLSSQSPDIDTSKKLIRDEENCVALSLN